MEVFFIQNSQHAKLLNRGGLIAPRSKAQRVIMCFGLVTSEASMSAMHFPSSFATAHYSISGRPRVLHIVAESLFVCQVLVWPINAIAKPFLLR